MSQHMTHLSQRSCRCCCPVSRNGDEKKILVFLLHDDALTCFQILPFSPLSRASSSTLVGQLSGCVLLAAAFIRRGDCLNCLKEGTPFRKVENVISSHNNKLQAMLLHVITYSRVCYCLIIGMKHVKTFIEINIQFKNALEDLCYKS